MPAITDEQRQQVLRLAREGTLSRNQIAKDTGVSAGSVTNICKAAGVSFDRTATEVAVRSRKADLAARRAELQLLLLQDASRLREQLWQPATYTELGKFSAAKREGGAGGESWTEPVSYTLPQPTVADQLKLVQAVSTAITTSQRMADAEGDGDTEQAKAMLVQLFAMLGDQWRDLQAADQ